MVNVYTSRNRQLWSTVLRWIGKIILWPLAGLPVLLIALFDANNGRGFRQNIREITGREADEKKKKEQLNPEQDQKDL
tara:strand:- start:162 stop:395 length:234 start_codon:yes stop_codon:yes gene_type:complete